MELTPFRIAVIVVIALMPFALYRPRALLYLYCTAIACFPNPVGVREGVNFIHLYGAGSDMLPVPLINVFLYGLLLASLLFWHPPRSTQVRDVSLRLFAGISVLYAIYAISGLALGHAWSEVIRSTGGINMLNMYLFMLVLTRLHTTWTDIDRTMSWLMLVVVLRGLYGVVRYVFFGGDYANAYANLQGIDVKLTFQDINDSLLALIIGFYAAWRMTFDKPRLQFERSMLWGVAALSCFVILFSFRRTAWLGLMLAGAYFLSIQPWRRRVQVAVVVAVISTYIFSTLVAIRMGDYQNLGSAAFLYDAVNSRGEVTAERGRFGEIAIAFKTIQQHWAVGVGPWGGMEQFGDRDYMHGGYLQLWLKLGILGFALFLAGVAAYVRFVLSGRRHLPVRRRAWYDASFAGFLFMLPNAFIGTPVIEFRTMQWTALCFVLPYLAFRAHQNRPTRNGEQVAHAASSGNAKTTGRLAEL